MEVTNELMAKFFRQECTPEEHQLVSNYFDQHPDELDKCLSEEEWLDFEIETELHPAISQKMLRTIAGHITIDASIRKAN